ncbi:immunoglobulin-like domain-containing protein [Paenilisteria rocourtiae]|uniref:Bacterial Ig domain-containing protein n=1 Tax=Listeria rocourtiae TaxID=647910 RepID=A0A4R6ZK52_9LIST|nr:immunoglobulin-like domain-containing protein [Listeria rocourtiae]EUJ47832.1 modifier protein of major autolysin LytC [Listeria rocourtiae FSL F6-920]MBC1604565.1 hypothetical protein [Listeria rocourtiae]TDR52612.1 hypothetical protein DFP96_10749 [Listeria rocourtiae]
MLNVKMMKKSSAIMLTTVLLGSQIVTMIPESASASKVQSVAHTVTEKERATSAEVSTFEGLKQALQDPNIVNITLKKDIVVKSAFNFTTDKNLDGQGHTIDMDGHGIGFAKVDGNATVSNINIANQGVLPLFWSQYKDATITLDNVTSSGKKLAYSLYGTMILKGSIKAKVDGVVAGIQGTNLIVKEGANVSLDTTGSSLYGIWLFDQLNQEKNSSLRVHSKNQSLRFESTDGALSTAGNLDLISNEKEGIYGTYSSVYVTAQKDSVVNVESRGDNQPAIDLQSKSSLNALSGSSMYIKRAKDSQTDTKTDQKEVIKLGSDSQIEVNAPKGFSITNGKKDAPLIDSVKAKLNIKMASLKVWNKIGGDYNSLPLNSWITGSTSMDIKRNESENLVSDNYQLQQNFKLGNYGKLSVGEEKEMRETTINELTTDSTTVTGTGEPGADIVITANNVLIGSGKVKEDGTYSIEVKKQKKGTVVEANAILGGQTSSASTVVKGEMEETTINELTADSTEATGTGEAGATIEIKVGDQVIGSGTIKEDGTYSVVIPTQKEGVTVEAIATINGQTSTATTIVKASEKDYSITADQFIVGQSTYLTGKVGSDVATVRVYVNGKAVNNVTPVDGEFRAYMSTISSTSDEVKVVSLDSEGNEKEEAKVSLVEQELILTANDYTIGEEYITGEYDKEATKVVLYIDGVAVKNSSLDPETMTYKVAANKVVTSKDQKVEMVMSKGATELKRVSVNVKDAPIPEYTLTANDYTIGEEYITGTYDKAATKVVLYIDGQVVKNSALDPETMTYKVAANKVVTSVDQKVEMVMSNGTTELERVTVNVLL